MVARIAGGEYQSSSTARQLIAAGLFYGLDFF